MGERRATRSMLAAQNMQPVWIQAMKNLQTTPHFALIEAVRGLAAILVVWSHTVEKTGNFYHYFFDPGKIGVVVFFFISGYLVIPSAARDGRAKPFLIKRLFRLYPLYWISLAGAWLLWPSDFSLATWLANISMAQQLLGFQNAINVYWTLTIEVCLYVIVTIALFLRPDVLLKKSAWFLGALAVICLVAAGLRMGLQQKIPTAIPLGLFCMFAGAQLRMNEAEGRSAAALAVGYVAVVVTTCLMAYSFAIAFDETSSRYVATYLIGGAIFLLVAKYPHVDLGRIPRTLGDLSFGIYLFHMLVRQLIEPYFSPGFVLFGVVLLVSIAVSAPLYYFVERRAADYGRSLSQKARAA